MVSSVMLLVACGPQPSSEKASEKASGRELSPPASDTDGSIRILLYYDMEGISGLNQIRGLDYETEEYVHAREWLTNDVNAVIDGLFAGGADAIDVVDAHGSGNPEPDILLDKMDSRAEMIYRDERFRAYVDLTEKDKYDGVAVVCMHSKTGGGGFAAHTYTLGMDWILNEMSINESEIIAYSWGRVGVPLIFGSGDDKLKEQLSWMSWLEFVEVKKAKGAGDADLRPFADVHQEMREAAKRAVEKISQSSAVRLTTPVKAQLRAVHPARLDILEHVPGIEYADQTVTFEAADFQEAYDGIEALLGVASLGRYGILRRTIGSLENGAEINRAFWENVSTDWVAVESGQWEPPTPDRPDPSIKCFGAR
jgi:D-amino peptidase